MGSKSKARSGWDRQLADDSAPVTARFIMRGVMEVGQYGFKIGRALGKIEGRILGGSVSADKGELEGRIFLLERQLARSEERCEVYRSLARMRQQMLDGSRFWGGGTQS